MGICLCTKREREERHERHSGLFGSVPGGFAWPLLHVDKIQEDSHCGLIRIYIESQLRSTVTHFRESLPCALYSMRDL